MNKIEFNKYVTSYARQVETWIVKEIYPDFTLATIKLDWSPSRRSHRGGYYAAGPGINLAMRLLKKPIAGIPIRFYEYRSFDNDSVIGGFYTDDSQQYNQAIILHEMAHAVQFYTYRLKNTRCKPHGPMFKNYYSMLRKAFLNDKLPSQKPLKEDYLAYIKNIQNHNYNTLNDFINS